MCISCAQILEYAGPLPWEYKTKIVMKTEMIPDSKIFQILRDHDSKRRFRTAKGESFLDVYNKMEEDLK